MTSNDFAGLCLQVNALREIFSDYDRVQAVHADIATLHARDNGASEGGVLALFGEPRSGKTKLLKAYQRRYPDQPKAILLEDGVFADRKEVVLMRVPDTNDKNFLERLLAILSNRTTAQVKGTGARRFDIQEDIIALAKVVGLKLLMLEETHQAFDAKNGRAAKVLAGILKDLTNESEFSLVISGTNETRRLFEPGGELEGRCNYEHELTPLSWDVPSERAMYLEVLGHMDDHLQANVFGVRSGLTEEKLAVPLLAAGRGLIGHVCMLIETAGIEAVRDAVRGGGGKLEYGHLAKAFSGSPLRRGFDAGQLPFSQVARAVTAVLPDDPATMLRGRTRTTGRDVMFAR